MEEPQTQSVEFNVDLPKPKPTSLIAKIILAIGVLALVGVIAAVIISRTATPTIDPTVKVMPADTMLLLSLNTQADQLPNFKAVGDAWQGSKEANQINSALQLAFMQTGFNWEADVQPWLGERVTFGLIDLGSSGQVFGDAPDVPRFRSAFIVAIQVRDQVKSEAFLASVRKELESKIKPSDYMTTTIHDEAYRGIPIVYLTSETNFMSDAKPTVSDVVAYAPVNDLIVVTANADYLKQAIDAALDGNNLAVSANYQTTMNALPGQNAFAMYMDFNQYMQAAMDMIVGVSSQLGSTPGRTPAVDTAKQLEQLQKAKETLQAMGGMGLAMTYEPTGIRFDAAVQLDMAKLPEAQRQLYEASYQAAANKVYESIPALAMVMLNGNNPAGYLKPFFDPNQPDPFAGLPSADGESFRDKVAQLEKLAGVDLNADLIDLLNGEFAFTMLPKVQTISDNPAAKSELPFEFAVMFDSSDAARVSATLDKLVASHRGAKQRRRDVAKLERSAV